MVSQRGADRFAAIRDNRVTGAFHTFFHAGSANSNKQGAASHISRIVGEAENLGVEVTAGRADFAVRQQLAQFHDFLASGPPASRF